MNEWAFLPAWPPQGNALLWFGLIAAVGLAAGELARRVAGLPRISGYVLLGMAAGPLGLGVLNADAVAELRVLLDVALALVLFELGLRLNPRWFADNPRLATMAVASCVVTFLAVLIAARWLEVEPWPAVVAACVLMPASPAILLRVTTDLSGEGQVTERALHLVAFQLAVCAVVLLSLVTWGTPVGGTRNFSIFQPLWLLLTAVAIGALVATALIAVLRQLHSETPLVFAMTVAGVMMVVGLAMLARSSVPLAALAFGVMAKSLDREQRLSAVNLGQSALLFHLTLFVLAGAMIPAIDWVRGLSIAVVLLAARLAVLAVTSGVLRGGGFLDLKRSGALALALAPTSILPVLVLLDAGGEAVRSALGTTLGILWAAVAMSELLGPIAVQAALTLARERAPEIGVRRDARA